MKSSPPETRGGHPTFSVVIPCHNEEDNLRECISRVPVSGEGLEIVMVDDGSTDTTRAVGLELCRQDPRVRLIAADANQGKASAVRAGFLAARGDILAILDADMTVPPEELPRFLQPVATGEADFVNGSRLVMPMADGAMTGLRHAGNRGFALLTSLILGQRLTDTLCGTKVLRRRDLLRMPWTTLDRWGDFCLLFGAGNLGLSIREVSVTYQERKAGDSKMRLGRDGVRFLIACGWGLIQRLAPIKASAAEALPPGWRELTPE